MSGPDRDETPPWVCTPLVPDDADTFVSMSRRFNAEDGHPLSERGAAGARALCHGDPMARAWFVRAAPGGPPVGYVILSLSFSVEHGGRDAAVDEIFVAPDWRGRGLGRWLLGIAEREARALGAQALHLEVERDNRRARTLYGSVGFESLDQILMSKALG